METILLTRKNENQGMEHLNSHSTIYVIYSRVNHPIISQLSCDWHCLSHSMLSTWWRSYKSDILIWTVCVAGDITQNMTIPYSRADLKVPNFYSALICSSKNISGFWRPGDIINNISSWVKTQKWLESLLTPDHDTPVCRAAQEDIRTEGVPRDFIHWTLGMQKHHA